MSVGRECVENGDKNEFVQCGTGNAILYRVRMCAFGS